MRPYACGNICSCCDMFGCPTVDAIKYYSEEESRLLAEVDSERAAALNKPLGIAFVTLVSIDAAQKVFSDHQVSCKCARKPPSSSLSRELETYDWNIQFAPSPQDIYWENLAVQSNYWYIRATLVNLFLFIVLFFLTTPAIVVNMLNALNVTNELGKMSPVLSEFLPTLLLWTMSALLPVFVSYSDKWLSHWTRSEQNHSIMRKTFIFLFFMVLLLPSLGLTSAQAFVESTFKGKNPTYRWECLFLPDKGAFFVNYVTTSAFIGTALELMRFPELIMYAFYLCLARSKAESASVRRAILHEFPFGVKYARILLIFSTTFIYSLSCPLITPFGLLYMVLKHLVDRYNIYWTYGASKISPHIHATAIHTVIVMISLLQLSFMMLSFLRHGFRDMTIYSLVGFCVTIIFLWIQIVLHWCKGLSPISHENDWQSPSPSLQSSPQREASKHRFIPDVLLPSPVRQPTFNVESPTDGMSALQRTYRTPASENVISSDGIITFDAPVTPNCYIKITMEQVPDSSI